MITITKDGNSIKFTFDNNGHYLQDGTIEVPINSLSLITDDSGMATFKKSASNDIFISATYEELGMTKAQLETFYKENMVGEVGGSSSGEVQSMIDKSISGKADTSAVTESIEAATSGKQDTLTAGFLINIDDYNDEISVDMNTLQANVDNWINNAITDKADATAVTAINNSLNELDVEATEETKTPVLEMTDFNDMTTYTCMSNLGGDNFIMILEKNEFFMNPSGELYLNFRGMNMHFEGTLMFMLNGDNLDISAQNVIIDDEQYNYSTTIPFEDKMVLDLRGVFPTIMAEISFRIQNWDMDSMFSKISFYNDAVVSTFTDWKANVNNTIDAIDDKEQALAEALYDLKDEKQDVLSAGTGIEISGNVISVTGGGITSGEVQDMIDESISGKADSSAVTEEISAAVSGKVDTSAITSSVTSASTDSEVPTAKAVHDAISAGGGGGKAIEAGRGISITTGETADTVSFNLPISAGTGSNSIVIGDSYKPSERATASGAIALNGVGFLPTYATGPNSLAIGQNTNSIGRCSLAGGSYSKSSGESSFSFGSWAKTKNYTEASFGNNNKPAFLSDNFGNSGNTLFSVGNGRAIADETSHNAFEVRQNGDIYIADTNDTTTSNYWEKPMIKLQDQLGGGGGGSTYSAGTNISIDSANTISCTLPITATSNNSLIFNTDNTNSNITNTIVGGNDNDVKNTQYSLVFGQSNTVSGITSRANIIGYGNKSFKSDTFVGGTNNKALNQYETDFGRYNNSVSASTTFGDSGNTLFSVGVGTADNARRNAFEIRQNGDIYINSGATDVNLQTVLDDFNTRLTNLETNIANILAQI